VRCYLSSWGRDKRVMVCWKRLLVAFLSLILGVAAINCGKGEDKSDELGGFTEHQQKILRARLNYEVKVDNWILKEDTLEMIMNLRVINNGAKPRLNYLTLKLTQYGEDEKTPLEARRLTLDVSKISKGRGQSFMIKLPGAVPSVEGISLEIERLPPKELLHQYKEF